MSSVVRGCLVALRWRGRSFCPRRRDSACLRVSNFEFRKSRGSGLVLCLGCGVWGVGRGGWGSMFGGRCLMFGGESLGPQQRNPHRALSMPSIEPLIVIEYDFLPKHF